MQRLVTPYVSLQWISQTFDSFQSCFEIPEVHYEIGNFILWLSVKLLTCDFNAELHWEVAMFAPFDDMYLVQINLNEVIKKSHSFSVICTLRKCEVH